MHEGTTPRRTKRADGERTDGFQRLIDDRDETIRLLNEALSQALDELERLQPRRAA